MITYINDIIPHFALAAGAPIYNGYLIGAGYGFTELAPINQCAAPAVPGTPASPDASGVEQFVLHPPSDAPVVDVQTLSDSYAFFGWAGGTSSNTASDRYMLYQVPGSSHIWTYQVRSRPARRSSPPPDTQRTTGRTLPGYEPEPVPAAVLHGRRVREPRPVGDSGQRRRPLPTSRPSALAHRQRRSSTTSTATRSAGCATPSSMYRSAPTTAPRQERAHARCYGAKGGIYLSQVGLRHGRSTAGDGGDLFGSVGRGRPGCGLAIRLR